jgi:hypothetical protein
MSIIRARKPGDVLGSGIRVQPASMRCTELVAADDPFAMLVERLEEAGATLLSLPSRGPSTRLAQQRYDVVHSALESYGWEASPVRPMPPSGAAIDRMDEAMRWLSLIPEERFVLRRILGARALVHPLTLRHLFPWRRLGTMLGTDHKTVQRWHRDGVQLILTALCQRP